MRSLLLVLDSAGIGPAPYAAAYGDAGTAILAEFFRLLNPWPIGTSFLHAHAPTTTAA